MGRIYRQGQAKACFIYRLFTTGSVEEVIYQRQSLKGGLSTLTLDSRSKNHTANFTSEELKDCFTLSETDCDTKNKTEGWAKYDGPESLQSQGCSDRPLLAISAKLGTDVLSHVHIIGNKAERENDKGCVLKNQTNQQEMKTIKSLKECDSDSSEFEF